MKTVAVLASGRGSNLAALIEAAAEGAPFRIGCVLANRADAPALEKARAAGIETITIESAAFGQDRAAFELAMDGALQARGVEVVALAGFMRVLTPTFVARWAGRLVNIHPSLLPLFPGLDTHARALAAGVRLHGCTVHLVTTEVDGGPIIAQAAVAVLPDDDAERLAARVLRAEHVLYPNALALLCQGLEAPVRGFGPPPNQPLIVSGWLGGSVPPLA